MHPLIPDEFKFYAHSNGEYLTTNEFPDIFGKSTRGLMECVLMTDLFYSFGVEHPGALTLHNYPNFLRALDKEDGSGAFDLAAVDILRDRERGVPRYNRFHKLLGKE